MKRFLAFAALATVFATPGSAARLSGVDYGLYRARVDGSTHGRKSVVYISWNASICDLSPNRERMLIYADHSVATAEVRGGNRLRIADSGGWEAIDRCGRWSPDGTKVAYQQADQLWIADTRTGATAKLSDSASAVAWAPDSKRLAYVDRLNPSSPDSHPVLVVSRPNGSHRRELAAVNHVWGLTWAPRQDRLALTTFAAGSNTPQIRILQTNLVTLATINRAAAASWSPNGRQLAFARVDEVYTDPDRSGFPSALSLWVGGRLGGHARKLTDRLEWPADAPAWSSNGRIAYIRHYSGSEPDQLYTIGARGGRPHEVSHVSPVMAFEHFWWSRRGEWLLYTAWNASGPD